MQIEWQELIGLSPVMFLYAVVAIGVAAFIRGYSGFGFSAGLTDYLLNFGIATNPVGLLLVGAVFGVVYYVVFVALIKGQDIPTPGREPEAAE